MGGSWYWRGMETVFTLILSVAGAASVLLFFGMMVREWWKERKRVGYWPLFALFFPALLFFLKDIFTR